MISSMKYEEFVAAVRDNIAVFYARQNYDIVGDYIILHQNKRLKINLKSFYNRYKYDEDMIFIEILEEIAERILVEQGISKKINKLY